MSHQFLYVMDPLGTIKPEKDTTFAFMLESEKQGVTNWYCEISDLCVDEGNGFALAKKVKVFRPNKTHPSFFTVDDEKWLKFDEFSAIFMRKDPPVDPNFLTATMLLDCHNPKTTVVLNNPTSLRIANEKLWSLLFPDIIAKTVVASKPSVLYNAAQHIGKAVLKPIFGRGGFGVMAFDKHDMNLRSAIDLFTDEGRTPAIVQEYLPEIKNGDKRLIVLNGKAIGALNRVPRPDDVRANLHVGGTAQKAVVTQRDKDIVERLAPELNKLGIHFAGIDIIGDKVTEINVTSPTGVQEIDRLDERHGANSLAAQVVEYALSIAKKLK